MKIASDSRRDHFIARVLFLLILPLLWQGPAFAGELYLKDSDLSEAWDTLIRRSYSLCGDRAGAVHPEMMSCIDIELEYQDSRLNQIYRRLRKTLPREQWYRLRSEQRQWLAGLEGHCRSNLSDAITGGQGEQLELGSCTLIETAARAKVLGDILANPGASPDARSSALEDKVIGKSSSGQPLEERNLRPSFYQCIERSGGTTIDMLDCDHTEVAYQDTRLNAAYRRLKQVLAKEDWVKLRAEQRQWLQGREGRCIAGMSDELRGSGGTAELVVLTGCLLGATASRAKALEKLLEESRAP